MPYYKCKTDGIGGGSIDGPHYITKIDGEIQNRDVEFETSDIIGWKKVSTLPIITAYTNCVAYNNEIHILGIYDNTSKTFNLNHYKWDGSTWTKVSTLPYSFWQGYAVVNNN